MKDDDEKIVTLASRRGPDYPPPEELDEENLKAWHELLPFVRYRPLPESKKWPMRMASLHLVQIRNYRGNPKRDVQGQLADLERYMSMLGISANDIETITEPLKLIIEQYDPGEKNGR